MSTINATTQPILYAVTGTLGAESVHIEGVTPVGNLTGVNPALIAVSGESENDYLSALTAASVEFVALPDSGWLEQNMVYDCDGVLVMVRQSHYRTIYAPSETPALFVVYREDAADVLDWIVGESVAIGTQRIYDGVTYSCIMAHTIDDPGWTPTATLDVLWKVVVSENPEPTVDPWVAGVYAIDVLVTHTGRTWKSLMNANGYEPGVIGTWRDQSALPLWVAPAGAIGGWVRNDVVEYNGHRWICTAATNTYAPSVWGWTDLGAI